MSTNFPNQDRRPENNSTSTALAPVTQQGTALRVIQPQPEIVKQAPKPSDILHGFRRRWGWALLAGVMASTIAVAAGWIMIPVTYYTDAWLNVQAQAPYIVSPLNSKNTYLNQRGAQAVLIRSPFVLKTVVRELDVNSYPEMKGVVDPVNWIGQRIQVSFPGGTDIMSIGMSGKDRNMITEIVNAVKDAYMQEVVTVDRENHLRRKNVLEQAYTRNLQQIDKKTYLYKELADQVGSSDSDAVKQSARLKLQTIDGLKSKVMSLDAQIAGINTRIELLRARLAVLPEAEQPLDPEAQAQRQAQALEAATQQMVRQDPEIAKMLQRIEYMDARIEATRQVVKDGENSPKVQRMITARNDTVKQLEERAKQLTPLIKEELRQRLAEGKVTTPPTAAEKIQAAIDADLLDKSVYEKQREAIYAQFVDAVHQAEKLDTFSSELESRKIELNRLKEITYKMGSELQQWQIELEAAPRVTEMRAAEVPKVSNIQSKIKKLTMMGFGAFFVGVISVLALDFLGRRVNSADEINYGLGLRVIGDLPLVSSGLRGGKMNNRVQGMLIESIDNIRTALLHRAEVEGLKVIMVTSSMEKEGKTTVSSQLAASLARSGRRTLLFDGDLRRPGDHRMFEKPLYPGISEFFRGMVTLEEIITETRVENLFLAPAGHPHPEALQALARGEVIIDAFAKLREEFDFIIVDSGPILTDSDSLMFAKVLDGLVLSVLRDVSRLPRIYEACERARAVNVKLLGAVINGITFSKYRSYYRPYTIEVPNKRRPQQQQQQQQQQRPQGKP